MASVVNENTSHLNVTSEEISEITNIINGLMIMMDIGDSKEFSNFFLDDPNSTLTIEIAQKDSRGREEIAKACDGIYNKFCIGDEPCKHWEGNIYLKKIQMHDINKTVILNRSYWKSIKDQEASRNSWKPIETAPSLCYLPSAPSHHKGLYPHE